MAVRNSEERVKEVIEAIINQTFKDWEFIIVEDGSDDNTGSILDEYAKRDERIRVFHNEKRMERCFSRNLAISKSSGEYIAVNDGDDISLLDRLEKEVRYLDTNSECYLISGRAYLFDESRKKIGESWGPAKDMDITKMLEEKNRVVHSSIMYRNTKEYEYREKFLAYSEDYDLILQMIADGKHICMLKDFVVNYSTKRDLIYNDYLVKQGYYSEIARYLFRKKKYEGVDGYGEIDTNHPEKYIPDRMILELNMKKYFFNGEFKKARDMLREMMKDDKSFNLKYFYIDSFLNGNIHKVLKNIKRFMLYK